MTADVYDSSDVPRKRASHSRHNVPRPRQTCSAVTSRFSPPKALRLAGYFGTSDRFWLNLQARYDLEVQRDHLGPKLEKEVRVLDRAG